MEELDVREKSPVIIGETYGLIVVAIKKEPGQMVFDPAASYVIESGDKLIALGEDKNLIAFAGGCQRQ
jgi:K+/H+ antiporter YhaU regulatory subunit KhtT